VEYHSKEDAFMLASVRDRVKENPKIVKAILDAITVGTEERVEAEMTRANNMEVVASVAFSLASEKGRVSAKTKQYFEDLCASKFQKHQKEMRLVWPFTKQG